MALWPRARSRRVRLVPQPMVTTRHEIVEGLRQLGVCRCDIVEVHSSLGSIGVVEGGTDAFISALTEAVGHTGTLVMSAQTSSKALPLSDEDVAWGIAWKVRVLPREDLTTRTSQGAVADRFRTWPGAVLGESAAAWGRGAAEFAARPWRTVVERGGKVLLAGVDINSASCLHVAEARVAAEASDPEPVLPAHVLARYPADEYWVGMADSAQRTDHRPTWSEAEHAAAARGMLKRQRIGQAVFTLFDAATVVRLYEQMLRGSMSD